MLLFTRDLWINDFCSKNFHFWEILVSLKLVNYTKLHVDVEIDVFVFVCFVKRELNLYFSVMT